MIPPINRFTNEYYWLSNFYPIEVELDGVKYPSVEHAYQAAKTLNPEERLDVVYQRTFARMDDAPMQECPELRRQRTAGEAKRYARRFRRDGWDDHGGVLKLGIMTDLVTQKFVKHARLQEKLFATWPRDLIEGNTWGDAFWGVCKGRGKNHLGRILMEVREVLMQSRSK